MDEYVKMTILPPEQIADMVRVSDFMLAHPSVIVSDIRTRFKLSREAYNMIFDLTMPLFRKQSGSSYWRSKYSMQREGVKNLIKNGRSFLRQQHTDKELAEEFRLFIKNLDSVIEDSDVGKLNERMQKELETFDHDEEDNIADCILGPK